MTNQEGDTGFSCGVSVPVTAIMAGIVLAMTLGPICQAQTYSVIHDFTGGPDGAAPYSGLTIDRAGNFYGTTAGGGNPLPCGGCGVVYKLTHPGSSWILTPIYEFQGPPEGDQPEARVIIGPDGALYGTTYAGGRYNQGTVFRLTPSPTPCRSIRCYWSKTDLHYFGNMSDGANPAMGDVIFDAAGNLYGTTMFGGLYQEPCAESTCGTVYEVSRIGGGWQENVIYEFTYEVGFFPMAGVILDSANNLYGTLTDANFSGAVYQLLPSGNGQWTENTLHDFGSGSPTDPVGGLISDAAGNFYGTTTSGGTGGGGTVFELVRSGSGWNFTVLYNFVDSRSDSGPQASLTMDAAGNLYGTRFGDFFFNCGSVFKLTPAQGSWTYTSLHDFTCGVDGGLPISNVTFDAAGNLYGTTTTGGASNKGVIWKITP